MTKTIYIDEIKSTVEKTSTPATELLTDGGLENWDDSTTLTSWVQEANDSGSVGSGTIVQSGDAQAGLSAALLTNDSSANGYSISQVKTGLTPSDLVDLSYYSKSTTGGVGHDVMLMLADTAKGSESNIYDFDAGSWTSGSFAGGGTPGTTILATQQTTSYAQLSVTDIPVPESGSICVILWVPGPDNDAYIDTISLKTQASSSPTDFNDTILNADDADIDGDDTIAQVKTADGVVKFAVDGSGQGTIKNGAIYHKVSTADVSNPPTDAELDTAFGTPATVGAGFTAIVDDGGSGDNVYLVTSDGTNWWNTALTKST